MDYRSSTPHRLLVGLGGFVVLWRLAAFAYPHPNLTDPAAIRTTMAGMGLWFLGCGLWAFRKARSRPAFLLALSCASAGLHWGGAPAFGAERFDLPLLIFYLVASSLLAGVLELHLALAFPPPFRAGSSRLLRGLLYAPVVLGGIGVVLLALLGPGSAIGSAVVGALGPLLIVGALAGLVAFAVWWSRWFTTRPEDRARWRLSWVLGALLIALVPGVADLAGLSLGPAAGWVNLGFAPMPWALAVALARPRG